jgi:hypothetical protein
MWDGLLKGCQRREAAVIERYIKNLNLSVGTTSPADTLALLGCMVADSVHAGVSGVAR